MIKNNGCKCCIVHDPDPTADVRDLASPVASVCFVEMSQPCLTSRSQK